MPPHKKDKIKDHITATIDPEYSFRLKHYRDDPNNAIAGEKPSRSGIIERALDMFLPKVNRNA